VKKNSLFIFLLPLVLLSISAYLGYENYKARLIERKASWMQLKKLIEGEVSKFTGEASIVVKDLNMDWEISLNKDKAFPSASLAKVPIMTAVFKAAGEGRINLNNTLQLKGSQKVNGSGVLKQMPAGSELSVARLVEYMIIESDNTAANILINLLGMDYLNDFFKEAGLKRTNLSRKMMDFRFRRNGIENYTTSEDLAYLLEEVYRGRIINKNVSRRCLEILKRQNINDRIPAKLPANVIVAHKTGLERNVCHDAGIVFTGKGNFLICILTKNADRRKTAKDFIANISLYTYDYYQGL